jgi:hypothetical protein
MQLVSLLSLVAFFTNLTITAVIYFNKMRSNIGNSYILLSSFFSAYIFFEFLAYNYPNPDVAFIYMKLEMISWVPIGLLYLNFVNQVISFRTIYLKRFTFIMSLIIIIVGFFTPYILVAVSPVTWGYRIVPGLLYLPTILIVTIFPVILGIKKLLKALYSKSHTDVEKTTIKIILVGTLITLVCTITSDVILPHVLEVHDYYRIGGICILFQSLSYFWAINHYYLSKISLKDTSMYLFQQSLSPIVIVNFLGNIQQINHSAKTSFNIPYSELLGKHISRLIVSNHYNYKVPISKNIYDVLINEEKKKSFISQIQITAGIKNGYLIIMELT